MKQSSACVVTVEAEVLADDAELVFPDAFPQAAAQHIASTFAQSIAGTTDAMVAAMMAWLDQAPDTATVGELRQVGRDAYTAHLRAAWETMQAQVELAEHGAGARTH